MISEYWDTKKNTCLFVLLIYLVVLISALGLSLVGVACANEKQTRRNETSNVNFLNGSVLVRWNNILFCWKDYDTVSSKCRKGTFSRVHLYLMRWIIDLCIHNAIHFYFQANISTKLPQHNSIRPKEII